MAVQARTAAAVMVLRSVGDGFEIFMVRRASKSAFMPDVYVFPGGTVAPADSALEERRELCCAVEAGLSISDAEGWTQLGRGVRTAAIRELFEEANVLLAYTKDGHLLDITTETIARYAGYRAALNRREGSLEACLRAEHLVLATDRLVYFAHWITPISEPRRYDTHFFLALAPVRQEALHDQLETSDGVWIRPAEALRCNAEGTFPLAFPTLHQLRELATFSDCETMFRTARERAVATIMPVPVEQEGSIHFVLPSEQK